MEPGRILLQFSTRSFLNFLETSKKSFFSTNILLVRHLIFGPESSVPIPSPEGSHPTPPQYFGTYWELDFDSAIYALLSHPGKPMLGQLVDSDYLLDFDIFHVSAISELLHYVDGKYFGADLDTTSSGFVDTWIQTQHHVDRFTLR